LSICYTQNTASESVRSFAAAMNADLEHDPEKWKPVFGKDHAPIKQLDHDRFQSDRVVV